MIQIEAQVIRDPKESSCLLVYRVINEIGQITPCDSNHKSQVGFRPFHKLQALVFQIIFIGNTFSVPCPVIMRNDQ